MCEFLGFTSKLIGHLGCLDKTSHPMTSGSRDISKDIFQFSFVLSR